VWRYIIRISGSPLSFKVIGLISRAWWQQSGSAQVCVPLGHSLMLLLYVKKVRMFARAANRYASAFADVLFIRNEYIQQLRIDVSCCLIKVVY